MKSDSNKIKRPGAGNGGGLKRTGFLFVSALFIWVSGSWAASETAAEVMKKAGEYYEASTYFDIYFTSKAYWATSDEWNESQGTLQLQGKDKFRLILPEAEMVSDGKSYWKYSKANKQVTWYNAEGSEAGGGSARILFAFLGCEPLSLKTEKIKGSPYYALEVKPSGSLKNFDSVAVYLQKRDCAPYRLRTVDGAGNISIYTVDRLKRNGKYNSEQFVFRKPAGVELVDLRE